MDNWWPQTQAQFVQQRLIYSVNHPTNMPAKHTYYAAATATASATDMATSVSNRICPRSTAVATAGTIPAANANANVTASRI